MGVDKEELTKILKFGAQNMFKKHNESMLVDSATAPFDITEFLRNAEKHEEGAGEESVTASQSFLDQFKVADFGEWEEVVPLEERSKYDDTVATKPEAEYLGFRRRAASKSYHESADRRIVELKKVGKFGQLSDRDSRSLIRSIQKFGADPERALLVAEDAGLEMEVNDVMEFTDKLVRMCRSDSENKSLVFGAVKNVNATAICSRLDDFDLLKVRVEEEEHRGTITSFRYLICLILSLLPPLVFQAHSRRPVIGAFRGRIEMTRC